MMTSSVKDKHDILCCKKNNKTLSKIFFFFNKRTQCFCYLIDIEWKLHKKSGIYYFYSRMEVVGEAVRGGKRFEKDPF